MSQLTTPNSPLPTGHSGNAPTRPAAAARPSGSWLLPIAVLVVGWTLSAWIYASQRREVQERQTQAFNNQVATAEAAIRVRMTGYVDALRGGAAYFAAARTVERDEWRIFVASLQLETRYPGINGIGVIFPVRPGEEGTWLAKMRAVESPTVNIVPFPATVAGPPDQTKYVITYIESVDRVRTTIGRDIATDPSRRQAAELARDTGEPRVNRRVPGSRDMVRRAGLLLYAPLYRTDAPVATVDQRRAAHVGWVYAQFFVDSFLNGVLGPLGDKLELHFFEDGELDRTRLLFASNVAPRPATSTTPGIGSGPLPAFESVTAMEMAGQRFRLGWRRGPKYVGGETSQPAWLAASFGLATLLLAGLVMNLQSTGRRANAIAAERTAELAASEERFRRAFEDAGIGMSLVGLDGRWLRVNRALCEIVGYPEAELLQKTFQDITHPHDLDADLANVRELLDGRRRSYHMEKRYFHRDGHVVWINLTASLVRDAHGMPVHFVGQIEDITARKRLEENLALARDQALEGSRLKSEFLATISHEIRTPMNAVIGMAELLVQTPLDAEQSEMAHTIASGANNLLAIINDILDFSRIEAGRLRLDPVGFDFCHVVDETVALLAQRAHEKKLTLKCEFESVPSSLLLGDSGRVRQVLINLIGNAIKFTDAGEVEVRLRVLSETAERTRLRVAVRDTGVGIPAAAQRFMFQPFTQADGTPTRRFGGTGLGLAICRQLVEDLMGGQIGYESEAGKGSVFWFELEFPRAESATRAGAPVTAVAPAAGGTRKRLLVAEDNAANQRVAVLLLEKMGYEVGVAANGQIALEKLATQKFDGVLMDCQMPVLDGCSATRQIRSGELPGVDKDVPIIALTAYARPEDRRLCLEAGMDEHVTKPIRPAELREALRQCGLALTSVNAAGSA